MVQPVLAPGAVPAPASRGGTCPESNIAFSARPCYTVDLIDRFVLEKGYEEVQKLKEQGQRILCIWDGSVLKKAESEKLEGLCPVFSRKATRRNRTKRERGLQLAAIASRAGDGHAMECGTHCWDDWVTASGDQPAVDDERRVCGGIARDRIRDVPGVCGNWGRPLVHVFDRGYASGAWLQTLLRYRARFVIRWIKKHIFSTCAGEEKKL